MDDQDATGTGATPDPDATPAASVEPEPQAADTEVGDDVDAMMADAEAQADAAAADVTVDEEGSTEVVPLGPPDPDPLGPWTRDEEFDPRNPTANRDRFSDQLAQLARRSDELEPGTDAWFAAFNEEYDGLTVETLALVKPVPAPAVTEVDTVEAEEAPTEEVPVP